MYAQGVISGADRAQIEKEAEKDQAETTDSETSGEIDFRNYVFSEEIFEDTTLVLEDQFYSNRTITLPKMVDIFLVLIG